MAYSVPEKGPWIMTPNLVRLCKKLSPSTPAHPPCPSLQAAGCFSLQTEIYPVQNGSLQMSQEPSSRPPTVPKGHKHRVTTPENPRKISRTPAEPAEPSERPLQNPRRDPFRTLGETPQSPLRGQFPRRASRRVVPLGW